MGTQLPIDPPQPPPRGPRPLHPPGAVQKVIDKWEDRARDIKVQFNFINKSLTDPNCPTAHEYQTIVEFLKDLKAAIAFDRGDCLSGFAEILNPSRHE